MSNYVFNHFPNKYGSNQPNFVRRSEALSSTTSTLIKRAVERIDDLEELFHQTLQKLSDARKQIAKEHKTIDAESFGKRRDGADFNDIAAGSYISQEYVARIIATVQSDLFKLLPFNPKRMQCPSEPFLGRRSLISYEILKRQNKTQWRHKYTRLVHLHVCSLSGVSIHDYPFNMDGVLNLSKNKIAMENLKKNAPLNYKKFKLDACFKDFIEQYPLSRKSDFILATVRLELNEKMFAVSQFFINFPEASEDHLRIEAMKNRSAVLIVHQDPFLIEPMMKDIAIIFAQVIRCPSNDQKSIKSQMTLFKYQFSVAMPFFRGTAAISEWFEKALYAYHGYSLNYNEEKMPTFEAWISTLKQFADNYDSMVRIDYA